jgi:hypothetical protein
LAELIDVASNADSATVVCNRLRMITPKFRNTLVNALSASTKRVSQASHYTG